MLVRSHSALSLWRTTCLLTSRSRTLMRPSASTQQAACTAVHIADALQTELAQHFLGDELAPAIAPKYCPSRHQQLVFFTRFGAYSATLSPARAGISMAMPRAWPSLSVAAASLLTKVASTAASSGRIPRPLAEPVVDCDQPRRRARSCRRRHRAAGHEDQTVAVASPSRPSRCGGAPDRCRECESGGASSSVDSPGGRFAA